MQSQAASPSYRADIDGLRAIAVLPVILFHAGFSWVGGGFVGVDVFFVISGFLITSLILPDIEAGTFSFIDFYERRARRLIPALFFVIACCVPLAWLSMTPTQLTDFGRSLVATALFSSNVLFWLESGYFAHASEVKPLLHTWSLGVEEQFYIAFPIFLILVSRLRRDALAAAVGLVALGSLLLAQFGANVGLLFGGSGETGLRWNAIPDYAYYLAPTRAWELLAGSLGAFYVHSRGQPRSSLNHVWSLVGLTLISYAIFALDSSTPFPGFWALLPVAGTVLVIVFSTRDTWVFRMLSIRPLVAVGLMSYSAYLWHQPLFAFARLRNVEPLTNLEVLGLCLATLAFAYLTWRFIEAPFRSRQSVSRQRILFTTAMASVAVIAVGMTGHLAAGFPQRFDGTVVQFRAAHPGDTSGCTNAGFIDTTGVCTVGAGNAPPSFAVIGDSHAASLTDAFGQLAVRNATSFVPFNDNWCAPLYDLGADGTDRNPACRGFMIRALEYVAKSEQIHSVILVAEWSNYTTGYRWGVARIARYYDALSGGEDSESNQAVVRRALRRTLDLLESKHVIIVKSVPEYRTRIPETLARSALFGNGELPISLRVARTAYESRNQLVEQIWSTVRRDNVSFVETEDVFCGVETEWCRYLGSDGALYFDDNHLSLLGAQFLVEEVSSVVARLGSGEAAKPVENPEAGSLSKFISHSGSE